MAALTDDILMAYADGVLDRETRRWVEALLHQDAAARRRVEIFRATGASLADLFDAPMREPAPAHLVDFVLQSPDPIPAPVQPNSRRLKGRLAAWGERLSFSYRDLSWQFAAASAAALILSAGAGWMARGGSDGPRGTEFAWSRGQIYATGAFQRVLEGASSGQGVRISGTSQDSTVMRIILTFKNKADRYCREYEIANGLARQSVGLACRTADGSWVVLSNLPEAQALRQGAQTLPSGMDTALDAIAERIIAGDAFGKDKEEAAISNGWK